MCSSLGAATGEFLTAASHNGFCSYKLFLDKKTNITQNRPKHYVFITLISYHTVEQLLKIFLQYDISLELCRHCFVMQPWQKPPLCGNNLCQNVATMLYLTVYNAFYQSCPRSIRVSSLSFSEPLPCQLLEDYKCSIGG